NIAVQAFPKSGTTVLWRPPPNWDRKKPLITLRNVEGVRISGFTVDGENRVDQLVVAQGLCPRAKLDRMYMRGFSRCAIRFENCSGAPEGGAFVVSRVRATSGEQSGAQNALMFAAGSPADASTANAEVLVTDCRFEGPYEAAVRVENTLRGVT